MNKDITKVYSGKAHVCMCGCAGRWSDVLTNPRSVKIIVNKMKKLNPELNAGAGCYHVTVGKRIYAAYF